MRYLLFTDTHLGLYNDSDVWHEVILRLFKDIHDFCHRQNIETIIHLGDFFHNRKSINTKTQRIAQEAVDLLNGLDLFVLIGNHDTYYKNKIFPTSLQMFRKDTNVHVVQDIVFLEDDIVLVPWGVKIRPTHFKYCMGHFDIAGFHMNDTYVSKNGQDPSDFDQFEKVFSGHFHTPSKQGKITYLGSPFQQTFHDADSTRGFYVFEDGQLDLIEFRKYPHFVKMSTENMRPMKINGNIIKLTFEKDYGSKQNEIIIEGVMNKNPHQLHVDFSKISYDIEEDVVEDLPDMIDHKEIIKDYVSRVEKPVNMKENTLLEIINKLMGELKDE